MKNPVSRSKMSIKIHSEEDSERVIRDGTAARTRPLSIQEIMLQREKKAASEDKKTKEGPQENDKGLSDYMEQGRRSKSRKEAKDIPVEGSKKEKNRETTREGSKKENPRHEPRENLKKDDVRYTPKEVSRKDNFKDRPKDGSKINDMKGMPKVEKEDLEDTPKFSRKERSYIRDDDHIFVRDKGISTSHKLRTRDDESRDANLGDMRAKNGDTTKSQKGPGKSWNDETVPSSRINDRSEKRNETKRKGRSFDDEKKSEVDRPVLKRHDSARSRDSKHPDKNDGRKDYAKSYHREPKLKRRRSRSRDLDQERHGRSISPPPREQRRSHRDDFGNYPPYYSVDKARRKHSETDKHRTSGNGAYTDGSYRRHESRLGGYSPRRKKTAPQAEATTTKTSSPVTQSPKKKPATWDQRPVKTDQSSFLATLHPAIGQMAPILANVSALKKDPTTKAETILAGSNLSADSVQLTQATRPLRRLHIENLPDSTTEDIVIDWLNDILLSSHPKHAHRSKPCLSCTINKEKHQAFVEFLTPEDATAALSFDGRSLKGSALKIRRPKEYVEMANEVPTKAAEEVTLVSDTVADSPHKIFVAGISGVISSEMLMEIVSAFGPLAAYRFLFNEELGGPCAFLEYTDPSITPKACAGLSGMKLGGRVLTAVHVFNSPTEVDNDAAPFYGIPDNAKSLLEEPTKVLQLKDLFDQEEYMLLSKSELEETLEDVQIECARFGAVKSVNLVEHLSGSDNTAEGNMLQPEDKSIKIEPTELHHHDSSTEAASECSVPNQSVDVPYDSDSAWKDVDPTPEGLGQKDLPSNAALCDGHAPGADVDDIQERSALPTLQQVEVDDKVTEASTDEDKLMEAAEATALVDDGAVEKGLVESIGSETCRSAVFGDEIEKSGRENKQLDADKDHKVKAPVVQMGVGAFVFEPGSVLVEFTREEAACMAAHSLHGRLFGNRTVCVRYAPHDLYLQKYSR